MTRFPLIATAALTVGLATPATAQQTYGNYTPASIADYEACKKADTQNQILGGVIGGLAGGLLGNEIEKGEGTVIGAAGGAYAGSRLLNKDCESRLVPQEAGYGQTTTITNTQTLPAVERNAEGYYDGNGNYVLARDGAPYEANRSTYTTDTGMVRVEEDGRVFYVSRSDYDRFYR